MPLALIPIVRVLADVAYTEPITEVVGSRVSFLWVAVGIVVVVAVLAAVILLFALKRRK